MEAVRVTDYTKQAPHTRDVRNELLIVLYLDIHVGHDKTCIYLSRFIQCLHNGV